MINGKSIVVRPLGSDNYYKNLKLLVNLKKIKTILPINEKRIEEMQVGEIWKVPLYTRFSFSGSFGGSQRIISKLIKLGLRFNEFDEGLNYNAGMQSLNNITNQAAQQLNTKPSYAGTNHFHSNGSNINITITIIHSHNWTNNNSYNRYHSLDGKEVIHVHHAQRVSDGSTLNIPFLGTLSK